LPRLRTRSVVQIVRRDTLQQQHDLRTKNRCGSGRDSRHFV
jgi:hypothetical protein